MTHAIGFGAKFHGKHKYHAKRESVDGIEFHSKAEAKRYTELKLLERSGAIRGLKLQVRYPMTVNGILVATLIADFTYTEILNSPQMIGERFVVEDTKGFRTRDYAIKAKLLKAIYGHEIRETGRKASRAKRGPSQTDSSTPSKTKVHEWMPRKIEFRKARAGARDKG